MCKICKIVAAIVLTYVIDMTCANWTLQRKLLGHRTTDIFVNGNWNYK